MSSDRNLLFGILAVQMNFISRDALIQAMNAWVLEKHRPLGEVLVQQGQISAELRQLLDALVAEHLRAHGDDPQQSLAALSSAEDIARSLRQIRDDDVQRTLASVPADESTRTTAYEPRDAGPRFRILRPFARGGLGEVFVAADRELHREVALKEIQPKHADNASSRGRFLLEAEVTGGLEHPGIVPVYGLGTYADGRPFYAMRFIRGDSLKEALERFHTGEPSFDSLEFRQLLRRFQDVCNAIAYAHSRGILHRDLKPGNIMLGQYGETLVVDWGLAKPIGREHMPESRSGGEQTLEPVSGSGYVETLMGSAVGTPAFMSPEQASGRLEELGPPSDVYSLGATLYVVLTGRPPFQGNTADILRRVEAGEFPEPRTVRPQVPAALNSIALKAMARKQADRYATATALADEIDRFLADEPVQAYREPFVARARRWARKHRTLVTTGSATGFVLLAGSIVGTVVLGDKNRLLAQSNQQLDTANSSLQQTNSDLELARQDADAKRQAAEKARETTAEQRRLALDTVRDVLLRVDDLMKNNTGLMRTRLEIIRRMLDDVDRIRDHALKNPLEERTEAIAYARMGEIYFRANRIEDAVLWLTKAHAVLKSLLEENPNDANNLRNLAVICHQLAEAEWRIGRGLRARELHADGLRLRKKRIGLLGAAAQEFEKAAAAHDVADSLEKLAYADLRLGDPKTAIENYLAAEKAYAELPPPMTHFLKVKRSRYEILVRLGDAQSKLRNNERARKYYQEALDERESLLRLTPAGNPNANLLKIDLGQSRMYLGDFLLMILNDKKAAAEQYGLAMQWFLEALEADRESLETQQRVAATHYRLALSTGDSPGPAALAGGVALVLPQPFHYAECLRMREELARIDPKDTQGQVEVLLVYARLGRANEVERTVDRLLNQAGNDPQSLFQTACGLAIMAAGKDEGATRCRGRAFDVLEKLLQSGWKDAVALETDPDFEAMRGDAKFKEIVRRAGEKK